MTVTAKIICDSIGSDAPRLTTFELRYPRFIHAEFMTHRVFGRNASSSRAIPVEKMIEEIRRDPACPEKWVLNEPGMQGYTEASEAQAWSFREAWLAGLEGSIARALAMHAEGAHKQHVNRLLEPWMHIKVVVTGTQWSNFLALRDHPAAEPTFQVLAHAIKVQLADSTPEFLERGQWHLPYIDPETRTRVEADMLAFNFEDKTYEGLNSKREMTRERLRRISAARCARTSYNNFEGKKSTWEEDLALFEKLTVAPLHASPLEHQASPDWYKPRELYRLPEWTNKTEHGNLTGWRQWRKQFPNECVE